MGCFGFTVRVHDGGGPSYGGSAHVHASTGGVYHAPPPHGPPPHYGPPPPHGPPPHYGPPPHGPHRW